jgi:hypothetical protein
MRSNGLLKNEGFLKTNKLERGKGIQFQMTIIILSIKYYKNQDVEI